MLQNFKFKTQESYVCKPKHYSKDIQVSNVVCSQNRNYGGERGQGGGVLQTQISPTKPKATIVEDTGKYFKHSPEKKFAPL